MSPVLTRMALAIVAALVVVSLPACASAGKGKRIAESDVPGPVTASIRTRFPDAQVTSIERERENGVVVYDFELRHNGRKYEADVREDGTIFEIEKEVAAGDVPASVASAVKAKYSGATIREVMEVDTVRGGTETADHYEVTLTTGGGKEREVTASLDGSRIHEEAEAESGKH